MMMSSNDICCTIFTSICRQSIVAQSRQWCQSSCLFVYQHQPLSQQCLNHIDFKLVTNRRIISAKYFTFFCDKNFIRCCHYFPIVVLTKVRLQISHICECFLTFTANDVFNLLLMYRTMSSQVEFPIKSFAACFTLMLKYNHSFDFSVALLLYIIIFTSLVPFPLLFCIFSPNNEILQSKMF